MEARNETVKVFAAKDIKLNRKNLSRRHNEMRKAYRGA